MWSYLWELAFENVHERDPEKDDCVLYVSQFSADKSSPKIPILCWRINRKKKTPSFQGERVEYFQMQSVQSPISI